MGASTTRRCVDPYFCTHTATGIEIGDGRALVQQRRSRPPVSGETSAYHPNGICGHSLMACKLGVSNTALTVSSISCVVATDCCTAFVYEQQTLAGKCSFTASVALVSEGRWTIRRNNNQQVIDHWLGQQQQHSSYPLKLSASSQLHHFHGVAFVRTPTLASHSCISSHISTRRSTPSLPLGRSQNIRPLLANQVVRGTHCQSGALPRAAPNPNQNFCGVRGATPWSAPSLVGLLRSSGRASGHRVASVARSIANLPTKSFVSEKII